MARTFKQMLDNIRKSDEVLMAAVVEAAGYVLYQYHANNRKVDGAGENLAAQVLAAVPVWLKQPMSGWMQQGKRVVGMTDDVAQDTAAAKITGFFREQEQKRAAARAKAQAKAALKKQETAQGEAQRRADVAEEVRSDAGTIEAEAAVVEVESALVVDGDVQVISAEEARLLQAYLTQLRMPALKVA